MPSVTKEHKYDSEAEDVNQPSGPDSHQSDGRPTDVEEEDEAQRQINAAAEEEARERARREKDARAQALTLEIVGDLPYAEVKPPENILFVCKLNPVTEGSWLKIAPPNCPSLTLKRCR